MDANRNGRLRDRTLGIVPLAELLIVSALFWCVIAGDVASIIAGNLVFKEDGTPIGLETLDHELDRIRSEEWIRDSASRRRWLVDPGEILAHGPIEGGRTGTSSCANTRGGNP